MLANAMAVAARICVAGRDDASHSRESAIDTGLGWTAGRPTAKGSFAAPVQQGGRVTLGDGMVQVRADVKGW